MNLTNYVENKKDQSSFFNKTQQQFSSLNKTQNTVSLDNLNLKQRKTEYIDILNHKKNIGRINVQKINFQPFSQFQSKFLKEKQFKTMENHYGKEISDHLRLVVENEYSDFVQSKRLLREEDPQNSLLEQQMDQMNRKFFQMDNLKEFHKELDNKIKYTRIGKNKLVQKLKELEKQQFQSQNEPFPYIKALGIKFMEIAKEMEQEQYSDLKRNKILEFEAFDPLVPSDRKEEFKLKYKYLEELGYSEYFQTKFDSQLLSNKMSQMKIQDESKEKKNRNIIYKQLISQAQKKIEFSFIKESQTQPKIILQNRQDSPTRKLIIASTDYLKRKSSIFQKRFSKFSLNERESINSGSQIDSTKNILQLNDQYFQTSQHLNKYNKKTQIVIDPNFSIFEKNLDVLASSELKRITVDFNVPIKTIRSRNLESKNKKLIEDEEENSKNSKRPNRLSKFKQLLTVKVGINYLAQEGKSIEQLSHSYSQQKAQFSQRVLSEPSQIFDLLKNKKNYIDKVRERKKKKQKKDIQENNLILKAVVPNNRNLERSSLLEKEQNELIQKLLKFTQTGRNMKNQSEKIQKILNNRRKKSDFYDGRNIDENKIE